MATSTYSLIGTPIVVGSGGVSSITFSSIPNTYTDLKILGCARGNLGQIYTDLYLQLNGDSTSGHYTSIALYGTGSSSGTGTNISGTNFIYCGTVPGANATANTFGNFDIYIPNYSVSSASKSISSDAVMENNATGAYSTLTVGLFTPSSSGTVSSVTLSVDGGSNFVQNSTFYLYGIKNS